MKFPKQFRRDATKSQDTKSEGLDKFAILADQLADLRQLSYPFVVVLVVVVRQLTEWRQLSYLLVIVLVVVMVELVMVAVIVGSH